MTLIESPAGTGAATGGIGKSFMAGTALQVHAKQQSSSNATTSTRGTTASNARTHIVKTNSSHTQHADHTLAHVAKFLRRSHRTVQHAPRHRAG
eukprot:SAG11_NODE_232_length_11930_cov_6.884794_1_plen_94_part_00